MPRPRKKRSSSPEEGASSALTIEDFIDHGTRAPKRRERRLTKLEQGLHDAELRGVTGDWDGAPGSAFVGLYAMMHRLVYGVLPPDLEEDARFTRYAREAFTFVRRHFEGDGTEMAEFMKWTWLREKGREEWAAANGKERGSIGPGLQFSAALLREYRIDEARRRRRRKVR